VVIDGAHHLRLELPKLRAEIADHLDAGRRIARDPERVGVDHARRPPHENGGADEGGDHGDERDCQHSSGGRHVDWNTYRSDFIPHGRWPPGEPLALLRLLARVGRRGQACAVLVDAHVHLHPGRLAEAIRRWFDTHAWNIQYRSGVDEAVRTLVGGGVDRMVALPYVHKPGLARALNDFTLDVSRRHPRSCPAARSFRRGGS